MRHFTMGTAFREHLKKSNRRCRSFIRENLCAQDGALVRNLTMGVAFGEHPLRREGCAKVFGHNEVWWLYILLAGPDELPAATSRSRAPPGGRIPAQEVAAVEESKGGGGTHQAKQQTDPFEPGSKWMLFLRITIRKRTRLSLAPNG